MILPRFLPPVCRVLIFASLSSPILRAEEKSSWEITEIGGEKHVAVEQIQKFYRFEKLTRNASSIRLDNNRIAMEFEIGSSECLINRIKVVFSKPVAESGKMAYIARADLAGLLDPMLRPDHIAGAGDFKTVILDPAQGAGDPGITNEFGTEDEYTFKIASLAKAQLEAKGFSVVLTRQEDRDALPEERLSLANAIEGSAVFVGISLNSGPADMRGIQTFPVARSEEVIESDPFGSASVALSTAIHGSMVRRLGKNTTDGGIRRAEPNLYSKIKHPAVLVKVGFMTHSYEARLIANEAYLAAVANGIGEGVQKYQAAVSSKPQETPEP